MTPTAGHSLTKWGLAQRLPHNARYDLVKRSLPGLSELAKAEGPDMASATLDLEILGAPFEVQLQFKNRRLYDVVYVYAPAPGNERPEDVADSIEAHMTQRYGEPFRESYEGQNARTTELYRWIGGSVVVDLARMESEGSTSLMVSIDCR